MKRPEILRNFANDLRDARRSLARYPVACAVAVVSLAAGIGGSAATLIAREVIFLSPPPLYAQPDQLSRVTLATPTDPTAPVPGALYLAWTRSSAATTPLVPVVGLAAVAPGRAGLLRTGDRREVVAVRAVTPEVFSVVGVPAMLGRTFSTEMFAAAATDLTPVILSHRIWQNQFGARPDAIGTSLWIDDRACIVVGVMPEPFWVSTMESPIWTPLDPRTLDAAAGLDVIVRRAPGVTPTMLADQLQRGLADYLETLPRGDRQRGLHVTDVNGTQIGRSISPVVLALVALSVLLTLLIAISNVAILMIAQWTTREQEIGIRAALGASRGRLLRLLLTESLLVAIAGGVLGICTTVALLGLIARHSTGDSRFYAIAMHPGVLLTAIGVTVVAGLLSGIAPALYETRRLQANPLRSVSSDRVRQRWRHALVIFEITVTVALLVVTGTMIDGYWRNMSMDAGFDTHPLLAVRVERPGGVRTDQVIAWLRAMPGVAQVGASTSVPMAASAAAQPIALAAGAMPVARVETARISLDFLDALRVPMRAGRRFTAADFADRASGGRVAIVNAATASRLWPNRDPLGASIWIGPEREAYEVVGVVADYKDTPLGRRPGPRVYVPLPSATPDLARVTFLVRAASDPRPLVRLVEERFREAGAGHFATAVFPLDRIVAMSGEEILVVTFPMVPLLAIGMLLTAAGVYSVLSFAVTRRGRELAVRLAMGATSGDLARLVVGHSARLIVIGTCLGVGLTFWLTRLAQGAGGVFDSPGWVAFVVPVLIVVGVGAVATWAPLRRVLRLTPTSLLRVS